MQKFAQISLLKKYWQKSTAFLTDLDMDTSAYSSNWSVFYTGATQIAEIRKNAFGALGGFLGKIVVKTRGLLQPCTGCYTQFWHILAKQMVKTADFRHTIRFIIVSEHCPQKNRPDARTKTAQKRQKKCFTHTLHLGENTQEKAPDFCMLHNIMTTFKKCLTSATF